MAYFLLASPVHAQIGCSFNSVGDWICDGGGTPPIQSQPRGRPPQPAQPYNRPYNAAPHALTSYQAILRKAQDDAQKAAAKSLAQYRNGAYGGAGQCNKPDDWILNPCSAKSAHHRPIGTGAIYASDNDPATRDWLKADRFGINAGVPFGKSVFEVDGSDPVTHVSAGAKCDKAKGVPVDLRLPVGGLPVPTKANFNGCPDGLIIVYDRSTNEAHYLRQYDWNNGHPVAGQHDVIDLDGLCHGGPGVGRQGPSASGAAPVFGLLRGYEINTPGQAIGHAIHISLPRHTTTGNGICNYMLSKDIEYPAINGDKSRNNPGENLGHIGYGSLLAIPPGVDIYSLGLSEPGLRLAEAIRDYGMYAMDGGGCDHGNVRADQYVDPKVMNQLNQDIPKLYKYIRKVMNNDVFGSPVAGGGEPLAPNCAIDAEPGPGGAGGGPDAGSGGGPAGSGSGSGSGSGGGGGNGPPSKNFPDFARCETVWQHAARSVTLPKNQTGESNKGGLIENIRIPAADGHYLDFTINFATFDWETRDQSGKIAGLAGGTGTGGCRAEAPDGCP